VVTDFKTYMTGEFFSFLSQKSILSGSVAAMADPMGLTFSESFEEGVESSRQSGLLHNSFLVRTNHLFGKFSKEENYCYLSGLLIGTECNELTGTGIPLTIVHGGVLRDLYIRALLKLGMTGTGVLDADQALMKAHCRIYDLYKTGSAIFLPSK
jgi:2-dehydro-3-deoxygalactonokinase